jgi:hypothetical protein
MCGVRFWAGGIGGVWGLKCSGLLCEYSVIVDTYLLLWWVGGRWAAARSYVRGVKENN